MLPIFGTRKLLCDGLARHDLLQIRGLGAFGLSLADLMHLGAASLTAARGAMKFGQARSCILLFLFGLPPQHCYPVAS